MTCSGLSSGSYDIISLSKFYGINTVVLAQQITIPAIVDSVPVGGYYNAGDGGAAMYKRVVAEPAHEGKFQDLGGAWFELCETIVTAEMFGAVGTNGALTDDYTAWQNAIDYLYSLGGGTIEGWQGRAYRLNSAPVVKENITIEFNGCAWNCHLTVTGTGVDYGPRGYSNCKLRNGSITVFSGGGIGSQGIWHSAFSLGSGNDDQGTILAPKPGDNITGVIIENMTLETDAADKYAFAIYGNVYGCRFSQLNFPGNATTFVALGADWGILGSGINSNDVAGSRTAFDNNLGCTTHPNNNIIEGCTMGQFTRGAGGGGDFGSFAIRLSGCYGFTCRNNTALKTNYAAYAQVGGDLGLEFALAIEKQFACQNNVFENCNCADVGVGHLIEAASYSDDIAVATPPYVPLMPVLVPTNVVFRNCTGSSSSGAAAIDGVRLWFINGGTFENITITACKDGFYVQEMAHNCRIVKPVCYSNRRNGLRIEQSTGVAPTGINIINPICYLNGTAVGGLSTQAGIYFGRCVNCSLDGAEIGYQLGDDPTQIYGLWANDNEFDNLVIINCYTYKAATLAYKLGAANDWARVGKFANNSGDASPNVAKLFSGVSIICNSIDVIDDGTAYGTKIRSYIALRSTLSLDVTPPAGFVSNIGDTIRLIDPAGASNWASECTTAGTVGTGAVWKGLLSRAA